MKLGRGIHRIEIEFNPDLTQPYLVSSVGALNMREQLGHFVTTAKLQKYLIDEIGIELLEAEKAISTLHLKTKARIMVVVRD